MSHRIIGVTIAIAMGVASTASAQITQRTGVPPQVSSKQPVPPPPVPEPSYVIGVDDVLEIVVAHEPGASGDVKVRPDGKITLFQGNDIVAVGLTTDQLKAKVTTELERFFDKPIVTIRVKEIRSRLVYITGPVGKPGAYPVIGPMTVSQLITIAGGLSEFADKKNIVLLRTVDGKQTAYRINYEEIAKGNLKTLAKNNLSLLPGDQIIVK